MSAVQLSQTVATQEEEGGVCLNFIINHSNQQKA